MIIKFYCIYLIVIIEEYVENLNMLKDLDESNILQTKEIDCLQRYLNFHYLIKIDVGNVIQILSYTTLRKQNFFVI